eukprot:TRINITY_DN4939_c0_g1_i1.p1 TRINITY_DN4939_c0_g1~~TRINITY_DN4939_c0_g1_i1.p1  ORF type:complete len:524 (-),score=95.98 TRINITY_DN4939_c0_g1_i1:429-2000(-)
MGNTQGNVSPVNPSLREVQKAFVRIFGEQKEGNNETTESNTSPELGKQKAYQDNFQSIIKAKEVLVGGSAPDFYSQGVPYTSFSKTTKRAEREDAEAQKRLWKMNYWVSVFNDAQKKAKDVYQYYKPETIELPPFDSESESLESNYMRCIVDIRENNKILAAKADENYERLVKAAHTIDTHFKDCKQMNDLIREVPNIITGIEEFNNKLSNVFEKLDFVEQLLCDNLTQQYSIRFANFKKQREQEVRDFEKATSAELSLLEQEEKIKLQTILDRNDAIARLIAQEIENATPFTDRAGFIIPREDIENYMKYNGDHVLLQETQMWNDLLGSLRVSLPDMILLVETIGIPFELRKRMWPMFAGVSKLKQKYKPDYYRTLVSQSILAEYKEAINKDVPRTFPENKAFHKEEKKLKRVLVAYSIHNPEVGYAQSMNFICGMLCVVLQDEESVFWMFTALIDNLLPNYYVNNLYGALIDHKVLEEILSIDSPELHRHLGDDLTIITIPWLLCLFLSSLPAEHCVLSTI